MKHINAFLAEKGLAWKGFNDQELTINWKNIRHMMKQKEKYNYGSRLRDHKTFIFANIQENGFFTFGDKERAKETFSLGEFWTEIPQEIFDRMDFEIVPEGEAVDFNIQYAKTKKFFLNEATDELCENLSENYKVEKIFLPEQAKKEVYRKVSNHLRTLSAHLYKKKYEVQRILTDEFYNAIIQDFPDEKVLRDI